MPAEPRAVVLLVHGYAEHSGRYEHVGSWLAARGLATYAYDHQGHGRSAGPRCHVRRFSDLLDDAEVAAERARHAHPGLPLFVVGHSMGGLVTAALACERAPSVAAFVTSGAALATTEPPPRVLLWLLRGVRWVAPRLSLASRLDPSGLSSDASVVQAYLDDPLVERRMTASLAVEMFAAMRRTVGRGHRVSSPFFALHGADDPICAPVGSAAFAAGVPAGRYLELPGMRHEIFNEPGREAVFEVMLEWLQEILRGEQT